MHIIQIDTIFIRNLIKFLDSVTDDLTEKKNKSQKETIKNINKFCSRFFKILTTSDILVISFDNFNEKWSSLWHLNFFKILCFICLEVIYHFFKTFSWLLCNRVDQFSLKLSKNIIKWSLEGIILKNLKNINVFNCFFLGFRFSRIISNRIKKCYQVFTNCTYCSRLEEYQQKQSEIFIPKNRLLYMLTPRPVESVNEWIKFCISRVVATVKHYQKVAEKRVSFWFLKLEELYHIKTKVSTTTIRKRLTKKQESNDTWK